MGKRLRAFPVDSQIARNAFNVCTKDMFSVSENVQAEMDVDVTVYPGSYTMKNGIPRTYFRMDGSIRGLKNIHGLKGVSELHFGDERTQPKLSYRYELSQEQYVEFASKGMFDESGEWKPSDILNNNYELPIVCPNIYVMSEQFQQTNVPIIFVEFPEMHDVEVWMEDDEEYGHTGIYYNFAEYQEAWEKRPPVKSDLDRYMNHDDVDMLFEEQQQDVEEQSMVDVESEVELTEEDALLHDATQNITDRRLKRLDVKSVAQPAVEVEEPDFLGEDDVESLDSYEQEAMDEELALEESVPEDDVPVVESVVSKSVVQSKPSVPTHRATPYVKEQSSTQDETEYI